VQWILIHQDFTGQIQEEDSMRILRTTIALVGVLLIAYPLFAGEAPLSGNLTVIVAGFKSGKGMARIEIMDSEQAYTNETKAICLIKSRIVNNRVELTLKGLPYGQYAIAVFHDENNNGVLDKNLLGVPKEAYGSSNNIRGKFGPPDYSRIRFDLNAPEVVQQITVW
jgi:uncharacterized protein (DUF2141 family)